MQNSETIIEVKDLQIDFRTDEGLVRAVDGINFAVQRGKTLGIVGESGSGKSVSAKSLMQLLPGNAVIAETSSILLHRNNGKTVDVTQLKSTGRTMRSIRGDDIAMIFQEPMSSFSPVYTIGNQISEAILAHRDVSKREAKRIAIDMLDRVGISNPCAAFQSISI